MTQQTDRLAHPLPEGVSDTFVRPCLDCGDTIRTIAGTEQPHQHHQLDDDGSLAAHAWWEGHDAARAEAAFSDGSELR
jgi:hypothetical protein